MSMKHIRLVAVDEDEDQRLDLLESDEIFSWDDIRILNNNSPVKRFKLDVVAGDVATVWVERYVDDEGYYQGETTTEKYYVKNAPDIVLELIKSCNLPEAL